MPDGVGLEQAVGPAPRPPGATEQVGDRARRRRARPRGDASAPVDPERGPAPSGPPRRRWRPPPTTTWLHIDDRGGPANAATAGTAATAAGGAVRPVSSSASASTTMPSMASSDASCTYRPGAVPGPVVRHAAEAGGHRGPPEHDRGRERPGGGGPSARPPPRPRRTRRLDTVLTGWAISPGPAPLAVGPLGDVHGRLDHADDAEQLVGHGHHLGPALADLAQLAPPIEQRAPADDADQQGPEPLEEQQGHHPEHRRGDQHHEVGDPPGAIAEAAGRGAHRPVRSRVRATSPSKPDDRVPRRQHDPGGREGHDRHQQPDACPSTPAPSGSARPPARGRPGPRWRRARPPRTARAAPPARRAPTIRRAR